MSPPELYQKILLLLPSLSPLYHQKTSYNKENAGVLVWAQDDLYQTREDDHYATTLLTLKFNGGQFIYCI